MPIIRDGKTTFAGAVIRVRDRVWHDGMTEEWADVWNGSHEESIQVAYYGCDYRNLMGDITASPDLSPENARAILRSRKADARKVFSACVSLWKKSVQAGDQAVVIRGRKIPKGTILSVFWVGERENRFTGEMEKLAGCHDSAGRKIWVKAEYLQPQTARKNPTAAERRAFMRAYIMGTVYIDILRPAIPAGVHPDSDYKSFPFYMENWKDDLWDKWMSSRRK